MGRPAKPLSLHHLDGTYRRDRHGGRPAAPPAGQPERPADLQGEAAAFWDTTVADLAAVGVVGRLDTALLRAAAELWGLYRKALAVADQDPVNKLVRCAVVSYYAAWERAAAKLGLSPADRAKLRLDLSEPQAGSDEFEAFLDGIPGRVPFRQRRRPAEAEGGSPPGEG
jgi:phage terminase small subunit